jgi:hypothetical protein
MKVFSTLKAEQIDITRTASLGVAGLKAFLEYAEKGKSSLSTLKVNGRHQDSGFIDSLANRLKAEGFDVLTNIGSSGFKIDIGIINPKVPSEYQLGVLCDGPNYRDSKTAKDREIIQSEVLGLLGWNIHKVWSCDWWDNQDKVIKEIIQAIQDLKSPIILQPEIIPPQVLKTEIPTLVTDKVESNNSTSTQSKYKLFYTVCNILNQIHPPQFDLLSSVNFKGNVASNLISILEKEAPISKELLCHRILDSWSVSRLGSRIDTYFNSLFKQMNLKYTDGDRRFYWSENQTPESYIHYRVSELESQRRDASDISPEEVSNAVREILENMISLNKVDLIKESAKIFGFNRIGGNVETSMTHGINKAVNRGFAMIEADRVFLKE